jgi:uncharacterized protein (TIGR03089 family)
MCQVQTRPPAGGDRPLVTWYHGALGLRVELSRATFGNWVAKTANLLVEELGLEPGDRVALLLPSHWLGPALLAACWRAGLCAVPAGPGVDPGAAATVLAEEGCAACLVHERLLAEVPARFPGGAPTLLALSDDLLGRVGVDLGGALPYARLAASMPDHFEGEEPAPEAQALLVIEPPHGTVTSTRAAVAAAAADLAARLGLRDGERLYSGLGLDGFAGVVAGAALPAMLGTGVVLERDPDPAALPRRLTDERVTVALLEPAQAGAVEGLDPGIRLVTEPFTGGSFSRS